MPEDPLHALRARLAAEAAGQEFPINDQAVRELHVGLMEALHYRDAIAESATREWVSAYFALHSVIRFLLAHDQWRDALLPLARLGLALRDLANGHQAPMLRPHDIGGGRPVSVLSMKGRGYAAGILGGLMKHAHMSRSKAAEWVSKKFGAAGHEFAPATIIDWRQDALNHKSSPELREAYSAFIERPDWSQPLDCAEWLIARVIWLSP